jgi:hypothetical protein
MHIYCATSKSNLWISKNFSIYHGIFFINSNASKSLFTSVFVVFILSSSKRETNGRSKFCS